MDKMTVAVIDGLGGGIGSSIVSKLKVEIPNINVQALGTNSIATNRMIKSGADEGGTGENAIIYNSKKADIIMGVVAILSPNSLMGEMSPKMAEAIGSSEAIKILIPIERCNVRIAVPQNHSIQECIDYSLKMVKDYIG